MKWFWKDPEANLATQVRSLTESVVILEQCAMDWVTELDKLKAKQAAMASFGFDNAGKDTLAIDLFDIFDTQDARIKTLEARILELQTAWTNFLFECKDNERAFYRKISKFFANLAEAPYQ